MFRSHLGKDKQVLTGQGSIELPEVRLPLPRPLEVDIAALDIGVD